MDDTFLAVALLALATVLIVAEVFIPSGGLMAIGTLFSLIASFYFAWQAWWESSPEYFFGFIGFSVIFLPSVLIASFSILPRTRFGKKILLMGPSEQEVVPFAAEQERLSGYLNKEAETVTPLTPNGFIMVENERINASSQGMIIDPGTKVKIIKVSGTRVVVRELDEDELKKEPEESVEDDLVDSDDPLDFDLPE